MLLPTVPIGFYKLVSVHSTVPRQGHGSGLMEKIVRYADEQDLALVLVAKRYFYTDARGKTNQELVEFYSRYGFELVNEQTRRMVRLPQELQAL